MVFIGAGMTDLASGYIPRRHGVRLLGAMGVPGEIGVTPVTLKSVSSLWLAVVSFLR
jgi:hypothetical protein